MEPLPIFIDLEASSLSSTSYPIEIARNAPDGTIEAYLISPAHIPHWTDWSVEAEQLHGITRATLLTDGKPPSWICRRMNHQLAGTVVYSDDPEYDQMWLTTLFAGSVCGGPAFTIHSADDLLVSLVGPYIGGRVQGVAADGSHETGRATPGPRAASRGVGCAVSHHALHHSQAQSARRIIG